MSEATKAGAAVEQMLTGPQVREKLGGVSDSTLRRWARDYRESKGARGLGPMYRPSGRTILFSASSVQRFLERCRA